MQLPIQETLRKKICSHLSGARDNEDGLHADAIAYGLWLYARDNAGATPNTDVARVMRRRRIGRLKAYAVAFDRQVVKIPHWDWVPTVEFTIEFPRSTFSASIHCPKMFSKLLTKVWRVNRVKKTPRKSPITDGKPIRCVANDPNPGPLLAPRRLKSRPFKLRIIMQKEIAA